MNDLLLSLLKWPEGSAQTRTSPLVKSSDCSTRLAGLVLALAVTLTQGAFGQGITGSITGTVIDPSGAPIAGATVTVRQTDTQLARTVTTSDLGSYAVTQLAPGNYSVTTEKIGFKAVQQNNVTLAIDQIAQVNATLELGSVQETVTVTAESPMLQTGSSSVGLVVDSATIQNMPLNSHVSILGLIALAPGIQAISPTAQATLPVRGVTFSVGAAQRDSYGGVGFTLDGVANMQISLQRGLGEVPPLDALSEFKVITNGAAAEFNQPAQVVAVSKSGTNQLHGGVLEFNRSTGTAAKSYYAGAQPRPKYQRNEYGGNVSGPIFIPKLYDGRNRSFFFYGYEEYRLKQSATVRSQQPTALMRQGIFTEFTAPILDTNGIPFPGNKIPTNMLNSVDLKLQDLLFPLPNQPGTGSNTVELIPFTTAATRHSLRVDHKLSDNDQIRGTFLKALYGPNPTVGSSSLAGGFAQDGEHVTSIILGWTHTFSPTLLVDSYTSFLHMPTYRISQNNKTDFSAIIPGLAPQLISKAPSLSITNITGVSEDASKGLEQTYQINTAVTKVASRHIIKAGLSYLFNNRYNASSSSGSFSFNGRYSGNAYADFLLGYPASTGNSVPANNVVRNLSHQYGFYIQDDFKPIPTLTLNIGLRYDLQWFQDDPYRPSSTYVPSLQKVVVFAKAYPADVVPSFIPNTVLAADVGLPTNIFSYLGQATKNIALRFGFAWQLYPNTVLRGAAGMFYNLIPSSYISPFNGYPFTASQTYSQSNAAVPSFTMDAPFSGTGAFGTNPSVSAQHSTVVPKTYQYNLNLEHQFPKGVNVHIGYVGQRNTDQNLTGGSPSPDINLPPPGPGAVQPRRPVQPFAAITRDFFPIYYSNMNSLQIGVRKRYRKGFMLGAEYQWVRMLGLYTFMDPANIGDSYGNIPAVTPQTLRVSYSVPFPFGKGTWLLGNVRGVADKIVSGWQLSGITSIQTGQPFSVSYTAPGNPVGLVSGRANVVPGVPLYPEHKTNQRWFNPAAFTAPPFFTYGTSAYNMLRGPNFWNFDVNLTKNVRFAEKYNFQLRAAAFNVFNHPNFGTPGASITNTATLGVISTLAGANRTVELGAKFNF
jgi:hypothetical protein